MVGQGREEERIGVRFRTVSRVLTLLTGDCTPRGGLQALLIRESSLWFFAEVAALGRVVDPSLLGFLLSVPL